MTSKSKRITGVVLVAMVGAVLLASASSAESPAEPPVTPEPTSSPSPTPAGSVQMPTSEGAGEFGFMTPAQYKAEFGAEKLAEQLARAQAIAATTKTQAPTREEIPRSGVEVGRTPMPRS